MVLKDYIKALRVPFITASGLNFTALWITCQYPVGPLFFLALTGVILAHLSGNLWNDYFDYDSDKINLSPTPFSGGSRLLQENKISKKAFFIFSSLITLLALLIGVILLFSAVNQLLMVGTVLLSGLLLFFYTAPPIKLVYRSLGEIAIILTFGPLIYLGIFSLGSISFQMNGLFLSLIFGLLTARILFNNQILDYEPDKASGKNTLASKIPFHKLKWLIPSFSVLCIFLLFFFAQGWILWLSVSLLVCSEILILILPSPFHWAAMGLISHFLFATAWIIYGLVE